MKISKFLKERLVAALTSVEAADELDKAISSPSTSSATKIVLDAADATEVTHTDSAETPILFLVSEPNPSYDPLTGTLTIEEAGSYLINVIADFTSPTPNVTLLIVEVRVNGETRLAIDRNSVPQGSLDPISTSFLESLLPGDEVQVIVLPIGGDILTNDGTDRNRFSVIKI